VLLSPPELPSRTETTASPANVPSYSAGLQIWRSQGRMRLSLLPKGQEELAKEGGLGELA
jgi:hypothetical protein